MVRSSSGPAKSSFENLSDILVRSKDLPKVSQSAHKKGDEAIASTQTNRAVQNAIDSAAINGVAMAVANDVATQAQQVNEQLNGYNFKLKAPTEFKAVRKRTGQIVEFEPRRITVAVLKALRHTGEGGEPEAEGVTSHVIEELAKRFEPDRPLDIEDIQDVVEQVLVLDDYAKTAKAYILYRSERSKVREQKREVPERVAKLVYESSRYFRNQLAELVFYQFYSRWLPEEGRRETWVEAIDRFISYMKERLGDKLSEPEYSEVRDAILKQEVCPSMRLLWSSGPAARASHATIYNCSYVAPTKLRDFGEIMYLSMAGAGVGFSVEHENVEQLPQIKKQTGEKLPTHVVEDSKEGWADAFVKGLETWFKGLDVDFDYSQLRPEGARLVTMGGRSSGPKPLMELMEFAREKLLARQGRRLRTIDVHDLICKSGEIVVAGGVRRSALISLSDLDDSVMRDAKKGQFYLTDPQRSMANNSAVYEQKPSTEEFLEEWMALMKGKSGERGIFNRAGIEKQVPRRRWEKIKNERQVGVNPCGEIYLRSRQFCNLTSIVVRAEDTEESLERKMRVATLLGTYQSTLTDFAYLSKEWQENSEAERLLGVSITGYYDNEVCRDPFVLRRLREISIEANQHYADRFGIGYSTAITCIKPHGNSSQLLDAGSGMHPRYAPYYIRRVRINRTDPLLKMLKDQDVPCYPEVGQSEAEAYTYVLEFPVKAPGHGMTRDQVSALDHLKEWKKLKVHFTEHNPSVTIYIGEEEWIDVANFLYHNWDLVGGLSFLPRSDHVYKLAPYEEITQEEYERRVVEMGELDFSKIYMYEHEDHTQVAKEPACAGGACEL